VELDAFGAGGTLEAVQQTARQVEEAGFAALWVPEGSRPVYSVCTAAALATESLALGTGVAVAFARSPMVSAQAAWMLSEATGGRFVLGLGTQVRAHVERRFSAAFEHPGPRIKEYVAALRAIFRAFRGEERLSFAGDFYSFSLLPREWSPGPSAYPDPPVYLAGVKPWMCRMIGEVADGMLVHPLHTVSYLDDVVRPGVAEGAKRAGRSADDIALVCPVMTAVSDDEGERARQREQLRQRLAFYGSTPGYGVVFDASGWPGTGERLTQLQRAGDLAGLSATITDEMIDAMSVTASWDELPRLLAERYGGRVQRLVCYSAVSQWNLEPDTRQHWAAAGRRFRELVGG
jgi:probable F420-dependent oxidoreductase